MTPAHTPPFFTARFFLLRMAVIVALALCTFLFFHHVEFYQGNANKWLIDGILLVKPFVYGLMVLWSVVAIWVFYPLLDSWRGRFIVLSGSALLLLVLMPLNYETHLLVQLGAALAQTPLPKSWLGVNSLSTVGHFLAFFGLSVISLSLFRRQFSGIFALLLGVALLSELLQNFAIGRNSNMGDFMVDTVGILVAGSLVQLFGQRKV